MDCSPPGSFVFGIPQARILGWVAMPSSRGSSPPRDGTHTSSISCIADGFFTHWATWEAPFAYSTINLQIALPLSWWSCGDSVRSNVMIPLWGHGPSTYPQGPGVGEKQTCFLLFPVWIPLQPIRSSFWCAKRRQCFLNISLLNWQDDFLAVKSYIWMSEAENCLFSLSIPYLLVLFFSP